jgi:hypothetical protein
VLNFRLKRGGGGVSNIKKYAVLIYCTLFCRRCGNGRNRRKMEGKREKRRIKGVKKEKKERRRKKRGVRK